MPGPFTIVETQKRVPRKSQSDVEKFDRLLTLKRLRPNDRDWMRSKLQSEEFAALLLLNLCRKAVIGRTGAKEVLVETQVSSLDEALFHPTVEDDDPDDRDDAEELFNYLVGH